MYILNMYSQVHFGKHKGKKVSEIVEDDPQWFIYISKLKGMKIKSDTRNALLAKGIKI